MKPHYRLHCRPRMDGGFWWYIERLGWSGFTSTPARAIASAQRWGI